MNDVQLLCQNGKVLVSSCIVAQDFNKRHDKLTSEIKRMYEEFVVYEGMTKMVDTPLFYEHSYIHEQNDQTYKEYLMNRDGFSLLVMGFTGKEALQWKLKYIDAFNKMEETIKNQIPQLSHKQELQLAILNGSDVEKVLALKEYEEEIAKPYKQQIEEDAPKVETYNNFLSTERTFTSTQIAKLYKLSSAQKLNKLLNVEHLIYKQRKKWLPYADTNPEYFRVIVNEYGSQLRFTSKGVVEIAKLLNIDFNEEDLETVGDNDDLQL